MAADGTGRLRLLLVRHAIAEDIAADGTDAGRALTPAGIVKLRRVLSIVGRLDLGCDRVISSPAVRAAQTAACMLDALDVSRPVDVDARLAVGASLTEVVAVVRAHERFGTIAIVGHEPWLGALAGWLVGSSQALPLRKATVAAFDLSVPVSKGRATLLWWLTPRLASAMGVDALPDDVTSPSPRPVGDTASTPRRGSASTRR